MVKMVNFMCILPQLQKSYKEKQTLLIYFKFFDSEVGPCIWEFLRAIWVNLVEIMALGYNYDFPSQHLHSFAISLKETKSMW